MIALAGIVGLFIGIVMGALGGGGGVLTVPILVFGFSMTPHDAATASLLIVGAGAIAGVIAHGRAGRVRWREGLIVGLVGIPGAWLGSRLSASIDPNVLLLAFAVLLVVVSALMLRDRGVSASAHTHRAPIPLIVAAAIGIGLLTGFFGVGGGFAAVPVLVLAFGYPMPVATGTSLLAILLNTGGALVSRAGQGIDLDWRLVGTFAAAAAIGNLVGGTLASRARSESLQRAFAVLLILVAIYVAVRAISSLT